VLWDRHTIAEDRTLSTVVLCAVCAQVGPYSLLLHQRPGASSNTAHLQGQHSTSQVRHRGCWWHCEFMASCVLGTVCSWQYIHDVVCPWQGHCAVLCS
jgi:hypothetical protein